MSPSNQPLAFPNLSPTFRAYKTSQTKRQLKRKIHADDSFVSRSERIVKGASDNIMKTYNTLNNSIGERPYGTQKVSEERQVRRYVAFVRNNPQMWQQLIQENGMKNVAEYMTRLEKLCEKYPEDANYMNVGNSE